MVLGLSWFACLYVRPGAPANLAELIQRASIGDIPGELVMGVGAAFNGILLLVGLGTIGLIKATGEVLPRYYGVASAGRVLEPGAERRAWYRPVKRTRKQLIMVIITSKARALGRSIMVETGRGVTELAGKGSFTGRNLSVLLVATTTYAPAAACNPKSMPPAPLIVLTGVLPLNSW